MSRSGVLEVGVDGTPLLGNRTGIGQYTAHLLGGLAQRGDLSVRAVPFTARRGGRPADLDQRVGWRHVPAPARALQRAWLRTSFPPVELLCGRVDVFHATNFVLPPSLRAAGVVTVHDLSFLKYPLLVSAATLAYRELVPRGVARAGAVLTPTASIRDEVVEAYRLPPERVVVTPLGVDPAWATVEPLSEQARRALGLPAEYVLAVGTFEPRKGLDLLLAAYRELLSEEPDAPPLVLVGPAGWGPELNTHSIPADRLVCPGYVEYRQLRAVVAGASVFAFPSRYEGFGLPPLEALAARVPVVASDIPTSREVLGGFAALPPVEDVSALADALLTALADPPVDAARDAGQAHALTWTWQRCVEATVGAYRQAAERG